MSNPIHRVVTFVPVHEGEHGSECTACCNYRDKVSVLRKDFGLGLVAAVKAVRALREIDS